MKWKDLSLKERKQIYDSVRVNNPGATYFDIKEQFDSIPAYEDGGKSIVDEVNKSDANFVQRLKSPTRQTIPNWEDQYRVLPWEKSVSTHKLSVWDNANGGGTIVPDVQEVNGKLIDFTRPPLLPKELGLTPGTPEYLERQKRISGSANVVQPEAYITPARNPTSNKMVKNQYDLYRNKNEYIDRLNKLIPMEILMPLGGAGFVGHELNKE